MDAAWFARDEIVHVNHRDAWDGEQTDWPEWLPDDIRSSVTAQGINSPWTHQRELADHAFAGRHAAICTSTASGKTLSYLLPVMAATASSTPTLGVEVDTVRTRLRSRGHTALYIAPTKALAHDQERAARELGPSDWKITCLDGDSDTQERRFARQHASYVLTNPDMLHHSVLPNHARWADFLGSLRYVIVDESHRCRGVFGAHVSAIIKRLRRLCSMYGADPVFILASATSTNAGEAGGRLIGEERVEVVDVDTSPHSARDVVLWTPSDTAPHDAANLMAELVDEGKQVICFVASRTMAELVSVRAQDRVVGTGRIASYRSGYLASDRRSIEHALQSGEINGVAATNALELGVDISGMDAVIICGFPGTLAALWQQAGRAGRGSRDALVVLMAREDPLDAYLFAHPELIFEAPVETTVLHPENPYVLGPQLCAAAQEACLTSADARWFGDSTEQLADALTQQGLLRRRPTGWFWTRPERAVDSIDIRSLGGRPIDIVDRITGRVVGQVDRGAADRTVHPGAVYLHLGETWVVDEYVPDELQALVHQESPGYYTQPQGVSEVRILHKAARRTFGRGFVCTGDVELSEQTVGYLRRDEITSEVWDSTALEMDVHTLRTKAMWWVLPDDLVAGLGMNPVQLGSAAHGAEHCAIGLLPMFTPCDRWDIGGLSTVIHPDTGSCTIVVHDGNPGGAGFAEEGFRKAEAWALATLERLEQCECDSGCPKCVVSPKCGNANQMLDKDAARRLMHALLGMDELAQSLGQG